MKGRIRNKDVKNLLVELNELFPQLAPFTSAKWIQVIESTHSREYYCDLCGYLIDREIRTRKVAEHTKKNLLRHGFIHTQVITDSIIDYAIRNFGR